ncbi:Mu transposase C-terminal domain-containing protein [Massilia scottii]|uniref:Mu transposase C-terminal domain-containing protein n=1 Tax=Massilia scottii TaxID=3057166 RepID=UPI00279683FC|nr:Mu transposase C-terminal domain-containing protein [Massilia sp. CCM 9029]MDQ1831006.1 Mu transposase C-terminal domain-containing protein [Massilia sp. CCM 9029]
MSEKERTQLWITEGATITNDGREYIVVAIPDVNIVLAKEVGSDQKVLMKMGDIGPPKVIGTTTTTPTAKLELWEISQDDWKVAEERRRHIEPLLNTPARQWANALADKIAVEAGVSRATLYRWVATFKQAKLLSSLLPNYRARGGAGNTRLSPEVDAIIVECLENFHDTEQKTSVAATVEEIRRRCSNANLRLPAHNTIKARIEKSKGRERTASRKGEAAAYDQHDPIKGVIGDADWPLALVQIDHTLLPVIIVDDVHRKSIRRAWITLAIDVNSRVCLGMYLTLDAPSAMSAGMCISHAIMPKEKWMSRLGVTSTDWPCWGVMGILHMDNAREFRGDMLQVACNEYDVDLHLRPVKKPRYGAHIERLMGTVSEGLKAVKGATFSGPDEKGTYDSEGNACMTFGELEKWLVLFFARYHRKVHAGIGTTPLTKWRDGLLGTKGKPGRGLPARRLDEEKLRIDFMPFIERTIQNYGVLIDDVHYYHDVLRPWINTPHPEFSRHRRKFRFHRDPRDISQLYFFDEIAKRHFAIPYRDVSLPPVSIWELREAHRRADQKGIPHENEKAVFALLNEQRELEADAAEKTKSARRAQQRRVEHDRARKDKVESFPQVSNPAPSAMPTAVRGYNPDAIEPLDDE